MKRPQEDRSDSAAWKFPTALLVALFLLVILAAFPIHAQTLTVLHNFTYGADGAQPFAGVTLDQQGRIYGTASEGGSHQDGVVYRLVREGEGWILSPIYTFGTKHDDGYDPVARVVFGPDGLLYGTTYFGGRADCGIVFSLQPPATACKTATCPWLETTLYTFGGGGDGENPTYGDLSFDQAGNVYGTTIGGGSGGQGVVFKLSRSGNDWTESVLWKFTGGSDGAYPLSGVIFDSAGNLYGTTSAGGANRLGAVYELSPTQSGWTETTLYSFTDSDNGSGAGGLIMDAHGDLFGITGGFFGAAGAAFELTPQNGAWSYSLLQTFFGDGYPQTLAAPTFDLQGNLYGPIPSGGSGYGDIFKLTPSGNRWIYSSFYEFSNFGPTFAIGALTFDTNGNMYGTSDFGGAGEGTVWEITP